MHTRATIVCSLLLSTACGPGPDDPTGTTDTSASTGATSTGTTGTTTPTTGATDESSTGTTGAPTTGDMNGTTGTTGAAACEAIVGSQDCAALVAVSGDLTLETCTKCQGSACPQDPDCDQQFPCINDVIVIQGCCGDAQCAGLSPFCGMFIAPNNVCVLNDDV